MVASVRSPDSTSGARVINTSCMLRRTSANRMMMATKDRAPASVKAPTIVLPDSRMEIGAPVACGAAVNT